MMHAIKLFLVGALTPWLLFACSTKPAPLPASDVASTETEAATSAQAEAQAQAGTPRIAAEEPVHDFGAVKATDSIEHVFKVKNVGTADLKLERVQRT